MPKERIARVRNGTWEKGYLSDLRANEHFASFLKSQNPQKARTSSFLHFGEIGVIKVEKVEAAASEMSA